MRSQDLVFFHVWRTLTTTPGGCASLPERTAAVDTPADGTVAGNPREGGPLSLLVELTIICGCSNNVKIVNDLPDLIHLYHLTY